MCARWNTTMPKVQRLAGLIATITVVVMFTGTLSASSVAVTLGTVVLTETPLAAEEILMTAPHDYPPAGAMRTQAQLMVPPSARWETQVSHGSLVLTVASGALEVTVDEGIARTIHQAAPNSFHQLVVGESVVLVARDRLVLHGRSSIRTQNVDQDSVIAAVIRVN